MIKFKHFYNPNRNKNIQWSQIQFWLTLRKKFHQIILEKLFAKKKK